MGTYRKGPPEEFVDALRNKFNIDMFIETGTWKAVTTLWAAKRFRQVITIEADDRRLRSAIHSYAISHPNIKWILGDSKFKLKKMLDEISEPAIFWLDAHSPASLGLNVTECPLLDELIAINDHICAGEHIILIDDVRCLEGDIPEKWKPGVWPTPAEVIALHLDLDRKTFIQEDVMFAWPSRYDQSIRRILATL